MRMLVTCAPTDDLWSFISLLGWREVKVARDRRQYVDLPRASFEQLTRARPAQREARYQAVIASVDRARSRDTGGTGLGLAIVRHVATNHEGDVHVISTEGEGSTFTLRIPVAP